MWSKLMPATFQVLLMASSSLGNGRQFARTPSFSGLQDFYGLFEPFRGLLEFLGSLGVEGERVEMVGYRDAGPDRLAEAGGLGAVQVAGHSPFGLVPIDWKQG